MFLQKSPKFNPPKFYYDGARILDAMTLFYFVEINGGYDGQRKGKSDFSGVQYQTFPMQFIKIQRTTQVLREKFVKEKKRSKMITNDQKKFDEIKIFRIEMFYDYYIDLILLMMQMLYYENYFRINVAGGEVFLQFFDRIKHSGLQLNQCFEKALKVCEDIKSMIEKQIKIEYPIETFSDKFIKK
ncbi:hypothetical protein ABPG72_012115 [Tetrahymena utriculariae]